MSIDYAAAAIGAELVEIATRALGFGAAALPSLTALAPAGAEEVSMQAAAAFAAEAEAMLALTAAAQQELARAGAAVTEITQMYTQVDGEAAGLLTVSGARFASQAFGGGGNLAAGPMSAEALAAAARTPLLGNLVEGIAATNPATAVPAAANVASTVLGAGAAPLSSIGQVASMGGAAAGPAASSTAPTLASSDDPDDKETAEDRGAEDPRGVML
ncbi:PE domain-containing protein [Mycobacterium sp. 050134]|uniref:PE domain-containing protein n=1 Tax=Mycobacterium sp. 050134 TaxID=3096111 RepID=UPI002ED9FE73